MSARARERARIRAIILRGRASMPRMPIIKSDPSSDVTDELVARAALRMHFVLCPECWGWPDCPDPAEWDRTMAAARTVLWMADRS